MSDRTDSDDPLYGDLVAPCYWCGCPVLDVTPNWVSRLTDQGWDQIFLCPDCAAAD